jgi:hypothetical protein
MLRRLFTLLSALSFLLCAAVCVLWVRSYWVAFAYERWFEENQSDRPLVLHGTWTWISVSRGGLLICIERYTLGDVEFWKSAEGLRILLTDPHWKESEATSYPLLDGTDAPVFAPVGLGWGRPVLRPDTDTPEGGWAVIPLWLVASVFAVLPVVWLVRRASGARRARTGCCRVCGYDLRATPGRCPECGTAPPPRAV